MRVMCNFLFSLSGLMVVAAYLTVAVHPMLVHVDVFQACKKGYHTYRIPSIANAPDDTLIAFAEGRRDNREDPSGGDIDLVYKRSKDSGVSWSSGKFWIILVRDGLPRTRRWLSTAGLSRSGFFTIDGSPDMAPKRPNQGPPIISPGHDTVTTMVSPGPSRSISLEEFGNSTNRVPCSSAPAVGSRREVGV